MPARPDYTIDIAALEQAIAADRAQGRTPVCIIASAGTVNTGALDDLNAVADVAAREKIWYHVDAAFGATLAASPRYKPLLKGLERADSVAFDFHKWFCVPYDAAAVLVRSREAHRRPFTQTASYLAHMPRGISGPAGIAFNEYGIDLSREFRALKVWMTLKEHGIARFGALVEQNIAQARYLADLVTAHPRLELSAPAPINVVCFRYVVPGRSPDELNDINREILLRLQEGGDVVPSFTVLEGRFVLRAAIVNHRSTRPDFDLLVRATVEAGDAVAAGA